MPDEEVDTCAWAYYPSTRFVPGEYCEDEAVEGEPYCAEHGRLADA
jgi:hypothetical protein